MVGFTISKYLMVRVSIHSKHHRLKADQDSVGAVLVKLSPSSHLWFSMHSQTDFLSTALTVAQKYPRAHRCWFTCRLRRLCTSR